MLLCLEAPTSWLEGVGRRKLALKSAFSAKSVPVIWASKMNGILRSAGKMTGLYILHFTDFSNLLKSIQN